MLNKCGSLSEILYASRFCNLFFFRGKLNPFSSGFLNSLKNYKKVMIEQFIGGREIQVAILGKRKLGAIELKPKRKFYDYQAKYNTNAKTQHIIKIDLPKKKLNEVLNIAHKAHKIISCLLYTSPSPRD